MNQMSAEAGADTSGGPMWGRFFESIGGHDDNESAISGSNAPGTHTDLHTPPPYPDSPFKPSPLSPEVHPNDSASVVEGDRGSDIGVGFPSLSRTYTGAVSSLAGSMPAPVPVVDDGTYVFKFSTPSNRAHRFQARHDDFDHLREIVLIKLESDPFFAAYKPAAEDGNTPAEGPNPNDFTLEYKDADGDLVEMTSSSDIKYAVDNARKVGVDRVVLYLSPGSSWKPKEEPAAVAAPVAVVEPPKSEPEAAPAYKEESAERTSESPLPGGAKMAPPAHPHVQPPPIGGADDVFGIPRDLLLPASIGALAVVIIAVFTISRLSD